MRSTSESYRSWLKRRMKSTRSLCTYWDTVWAAITSSTSWTTSLKAGRTSTSRASFRLELHGVVPWNLLRSWFQVKLPLSVCVYCRMKTAYCGILMYWLLGQQNVYIVQLYNVYVARRRVPGWASRHTQCCSQSCVYVQFACSLALMLILREPASAKLPFVFGVYLRKQRRHPNDFQHQDPWGAEDDDD